MLIAKERKRRKENLVEVSCKEKIRGRKHLLTNTEIKIADYVLEHYENILDNNITELAENAGVSDASVVRFCKSLGYKGYQDFKINVARDVLPKGKHYDFGLSREDDAETICKKMFSAEIAVLNRTLSSLKMPDVEAAAALIGQAEKIVIFGSGGSLLVAKDCQHKFMKVGIPVFVYEDADMQLMASSQMSSKDVAICISHSGTNYSVLRCLKNAKEKGAKTIALVGQKKMPISKAADIALYAASEETMFGSLSVSTRIAQLSLLDAIIAIVAFQNYDASHQAIQETRRAMAEHKY